MSVVSPKEGRLLLAGDIGGTKTDLTVVSTEGGPRSALAKRRYASADYPGLAEMAGAFLEASGLEVEAASFDVAGPVLGGTAQLTNLTWRLEETTLAAELGIHHVWLMNDLVAIASAIPLLQQQELHQVQEGAPAPGGAIGVLAPGTGLGEAFLTAGERGYLPHASEGGHAGFAPSSELELDLLQWLWREFDHVSFERVASGVGIPNLYDFLRERGEVGESESLAGELADSTDRTRPIITAALRQDAPDPLAAATVELFLNILGTEAGNLALKVLATGGVYLAGGIAQALRDQLGTPAFLDAFTRAGRFRSMLQRLPVYVIMSPEVALLGAANEGLRLLEARVRAPAGGRGKQDQTR
jgi:glucokinase